MRTHFARLLITYVLAMAATLMPAAAALAQTPAPPPNLRNAPPVWAGYLLMAVLMVIVVGISLLPSKRSHQD
jgi:hypothetical protein